MSTLDVVLLVKKNLDGFLGLTELFVDTEGLIKELILVLLSDSCEFLAIVVVKSVDIVHDLGLIGLDGSQDEQVLEILVVGES